MSVFAFLPAARTLQGILGSPVLLALKPYRRRDRGAGGFGPDDSFVLGGQFAGRGTAGRPARLIRLLDQHFSAAQVATTSGSELFIRRQHAPAITSAAAGRQTRPRR